MNEISPCLTPEQRIVATLHRSALLNNYQIIEKKSLGLKLLPMIKADAYGHGSIWVALELLQMKSLLGFGVATLAEGQTLREGLRTKNNNIPVIVFSGATLWSQEKGDFCLRHQLTPVLTTKSDLDLFFKQKWDKKLSYQIKFNTGMNRLGIPMDALPEVLKILSGKSEQELPNGILSHLAIGEKPSARLSQQQAGNFLRIQSALKPLLPNAQFHLGNSSAIWNLEKWRLEKLTDVVRPGLSLYGIRPFPEASPDGLKPVMDLRTKILSVLELKSGDSLGYGAKFSLPKSPKGRTKKVAILAAGYADGIHRLLGGPGRKVGSVYLDGKRPFLGVISMDLSAVESGPQTKPGDWAQILGPNIDAWSQAEAAGTIPYELLTSTSERVERNYV